MNAQEEKSRKRGVYHTTPNSIAEAAAALHVTPRTIWRWIGEQRVEINESKTAGGKVILRKIYDKNGREIWHARRVITYIEGVPYARKKDIPYLKRTKKV